MMRPFDDLRKMIEIVRTHNGSEPSTYVASSPEEVAFLEEATGQKMIVHYSATELFMHPRDYEVKELYSMAWEQFPYANQQEITKIVIHLAAGEYTEACKVADDVTRFVEF